MIYAKLKTDLTPFWAFLLLFGVCIVIFRNSFATGFRVDEVGLAELHQQFGKDNFFHQAMLTKGDKFRPIELGLFGQMYGLFQQNFALYHVVGAGLLSLSGWALYLFLRQVFGWSCWSAMGTAILFIAHPVNSVTMDFIGGQFMNLKTAFLIFACLWAWMFKQSGRGRFRVYALGALGLALMCHETAIAGPLYIMTVFWTKGDSWKSAVKGSVPYFLLAIIYILLWSTVLTHAGSGGFMRSLIASFSVFPEYVAGIFSLLLWFLGILFHPVGIVTVFSQVIAVKGNGLWQGVLLFSACGFLFWHSPKRSMYQLGILWFWGGCLPVVIASFYGHPGHSSFLVVEPFWLGMSQAGFIIFLGAMLKQMMEAGYFKTALGGLAIIVILWSSLTNIYGLIWRDPKSFYMYFIQQSPRERGVYCHLAREFVREKNFILARDAYRECFAGEQGPFLGPYYFYLAVLDLQEERWPQAQQNLLLALKHHPGLTEAAYNLGLLYFRAKDWPNAQKYFNYVVRATPQAPAARLRGQAKDHLDQLDALLDRRPGSGGK